MIFFSIVITSKNEEVNLLNCFKSIRLQTYKDYEILLVDNNSTDKSKQIASKYTDKIYNIGPERSAQRNFGLNKSKGSHLIFLDADMILSPTTLELAKSRFENNKNISALYVKEIILGNNIWNKIRNFERQFYSGTYIDCVRIFKKKLFHQVKGFNEDLTGPEDWDFNNKINLITKPKILEKNTILELNIVNQFMNEFKHLDIKKNDLNLPLIFHNETKISLNETLNKKMYYSNNFPKYINIWGKNNKFIKFQLGIVNRFFKIYFIQDNWKKITNHPILFILMYLSKIYFALHLLFATLLNIMIINKKIN